MTQETGDGRDDNVGTAVEESRAKGAEIAIGPLTRNLGPRRAMATSGKIRVGIVGANPSRGFASIAHIPAFVAQLYAKLAESLRDGKPVSPGFHAAVTRHRLLDAIVRASETGMKQGMQRV